MFVLVNVLSLVFVAKFVPETQGQSLEELEVHFRTGALPIVVPAGTAAAAGEAAATR